ncbi:arylsulfatase [Bacteroidota bacterium]
MRTLLLVLCTICMHQGITAQRITTKDSPPNIILILADDLGYGELGCYGQKLIETPNIDKLAASGLRFTQAYCGSPVCAPSRCVLLTGMHSGHAQIRGNDEWKVRGDTWGYLSMLADSTLEGQRPMKSGTFTLAQLMQQAGYSTAIIGKWGLGAPHTESTPNKLGFDYFFGYNCQRQAHTYYPLHLWENDHRVYLDNDTVAPHKRLKKDADPLNPDSYQNFSLNEYSPDLMVDAAQKFIKQNKDHPFFLYFATPIPHLPLQAPEKWVQYYHSKFGNEPPYLGDKGYFPHRYPHAAYAAMISCLDEQVGMLVETLKKLGIYDNTLIIFTSDNGPSYTGGTDSPWFSSGGELPVDYGRGKGFLYEGGIRVPMIASWPGNITPGTVNDAITSFQDILPTFRDITGSTLSYSPDGISQLPLLLGKKEYETHPYLYWEIPEYGGQQAVRMGKWKAIRKNIKKGNLEIELYNLESDIREEHNIAKDNPQIIRQIEEILKQEHIRSDNRLFQFEVLGD